MDTNAKPHRAGRGFVESGTGNIDGENPITIRKRIQLFEILDKDCKSAVIVLPGEARP